MSDPKHVELSVDRALCMGSGRCVADATHLFDLDADHKAALVGDPSGLSVDEASDLVFGCPGGAIIASVDGVELA